MNKLNDHTFIVPDNDGESRKIIELCQSYDLFLKVSGQKWGATLDREPDSTFSDLKPVVVTVEIPGLKKEKELKEAGFKLAIVDHHIYKINGDVLYRSNRLSSLEQISNMIGHNMNRFEKGLALNDRGYIWLLQEEGYSMEEIDRIRRFDLSAQGYTEREFEISQNDYNSGYVDNKKSTYIVMTDTGKTSYIADLHQFKSESTQDLIVFSREHELIKEVNFYGSPEKCQHLFSKFNGWLGGDEKHSMFWGCNTHVPDMSKILDEL